MGNWFFVIFLTAMGGMLLMNSKRAAGESIEAWKRIGYSAPSEAFYLTLFILGGSVFLIVGVLTMLGWIDLA